MKPPDVKSMTLMEGPWWHSKEETTVAIPCVWMMSCIVRGILLPVGVIVAFERRNMDNAVKQYSAVVGRGTCVCLSYSWMMRASFAIHSGYEMF